MKLLPIAASLALAMTLVGCQSAKTGDLSGAVSTVSTASKALTLSDSDVVALSNESCEAMDAQSKIAPANSKYTQRLNKVISGMPGTINGKKAVYKVYMTDDVNAWAMANGCIRVYSGLMDLMNDDELRGVIGHEIGHVGLGHSKARMQTAYAASAARTIAGNSGGAIAALSRSQAGDLAEKVINAQFSQSQESAADDYSFDLLTEKKMNRQGLVTAFQKLAKLSGGSSGASSIMSSHPPSEARAKRMQERLDGKK